MSMAMRMMKKMGWQEGKGLGKNQDAGRAVGREERRRDTGGLLNQSFIFGKERDRRRVASG